MYSDLQTKIKKKLRIITYQVYPFVNKNKTFIIAKQKICYDTIKCVLPSC